MKHWSKIEIQKIRHEQRKKDHQLIDNLIIIDWHQKSLKETQLNTE